MRNAARSFLIGYVAIPIAFYCVNILGHLPLLTVWFPIALTIALAVTTLGVLRMLQRWRDRLRISAPLALSLGGMLGLLHWFRLYVAFGGRVLWQPAHPSPSLGWPRFFALTFVIPIISLSGATYDGSLLGILVSMAILIRTGIAWRDQVRTRSPT